MATAQAPSRDTTAQTQLRDTIRTPAVVDTVRLPVRPSLAEADSIGVPPGSDSTRLIRAALRHAKPTELKGFEKPRWVMLRSLVVPGWGQAHNGSWFKAVAIGGTEAYLIARIIEDGLALKRKRDEIDDAAGNPARQEVLVAEYDERSDRFVGRQWLLGGVLAYSLVDAYIDAHFRHFRLEFEDDPALPPEERRGAGLKLFWQETF